MSRKPKKPPAPERVDPGAATMSYLFGSGSDYEGMGVASPEVQRAILDAEATFGPEYVRNQLERSEFGLFGDESTSGLLDQQQRSARAHEAIRAETASAQRASDVGDVERLGERAVHASRYADVDQASLMESERAIVDDLFARASGVTGQQERMAQQGSREAYGDRGREMGNTSIFGEALGREEYLRQNRAEALGAAGHLFSQYEQTGGDPFSMILGRPSGQAQQYAQLSGQQALGLDTTGQTFNPDAGINLEQQYQSNLAGYNSAIHGARAKRSGSIFGSILGAAGSIFGGPIGGAIGKGIGGAFDNR